MNQTQTQTQRLRPIPLAQSGTLILLLVLLFLLDRGAHLLYGALSFGLLAAYHLLTDHRHTPEQIRAAGLLALHIAVYLLLCTLVIWATTGEEESPYWLIYLLPVTVAATQLNLRGTLFTCTAAALLLAGFSPTELFLDPRKYREDIVEIIVSGLSFFIAGVLIQTFSALNRRQLAQQQELNERLLENQAVLKESLERLEAAEESLRRRDRLAALGEMSAGIAHEIRNPLGIISASAQLLGKRQEAAAGAGQLLDIIQEEAARLDGLITDFLSFGRPAQPHLQSVDLKGVLLRAVDHLDGMARQRGVAVRAELPEASLPGRVDPDMMQQVLLNLLLNALDATPAGGQIIARACREEGGLRLEIHDTGGGISEENLGKVFNPFFTTKEKGTGLGLANAYRMVEAHGGELTVRSAPEEGTTFTVRLPLEESF